LVQGYLALVDIFSNVNSYASNFLVQRNKANLTRFFKAPDYDVALVEYAQSIRQPFGINEIFSSGNTNTTTNKFTGPTMVYLPQYSGSITNEINRLFRDNLITYFVMASKLLSI
jgi:hypothetical protein